MREKRALSDLAQALPGSDLLRAAYERRARQLWSFGRRLGLDIDTAEDCMQEAFSRVMNQPADSVANIDAWLFRVVHNLAVDHLRRAAGTREVVARAFPEMGLPNEDQVALWALVDGLPDRQRAVVYLRYRADLDFATIAGILGITEGGARSNCARALDSLRDAMGTR